MNLWSHCPPQIAMLSSTEALSMDGQKQICQTQQVAWRELGLRVLKIDRNSFKHQLGS